MSAINAITPSIDQSSARIIANGNSTPAMAANEESLKRQLKVLNVH